MKSNGIIYAVWTLLSILQITITLGKAYPSLVSSTNQYFESLCNNDTNNERFVESDGRRSSFFLELRSNAMIRKKLCERNFTTSESHGFIIRLIIAKNKLYNIPRRISNSNSNSGRNSDSSSSLNSNSNSNINSMNSQGKSIFKSSAGSSQHSANKYHTYVSHLSKTQSNSNKSCPLTIYNINEDINQQQVLWQIDPCQLEQDDITNTNENNWPVKFFEGHIRIQWDHNHNTVHSKLMITTLGKGEEECNKPNKFPCLTIGDSAMFCISKDLACDNIRHCPNGNLYADDEDKKMCEKFNTPPIFSPSATVIFDSEWERQLMLWMQHAFGDLSQTKIGSESFNPFEDYIDKEYHDGRPALINPQETNLQNGDDDDNLFDLNDDGKDKKTPVTTISTTRKNNNKSTLTGDLSKYGPWGYLMLGMLLCGGALLICGLWECCCRNNKNESHITGSTVIGNTTTIQDTNDQQSSRNNLQSNITPPNYDELDPPPAYSVLFPNQKGTSSSGSTESSSQQPAPPYSNSSSIPVTTTILRGDSMVTVPVVVVVPGGARSNNSSNNFNSNTTSDLTPASSS